MKIKAILFDLGKVILHFDFAPAYRRLAKSSGLSPEAIRTSFMRSGLEVLYDGGKLSSRAFYREVKKTLRHSLDYRAFQKVWNEIFTPNLRIIRLIRRLSRRYRLVLISNTNAMHYRYLQRKYSSILGCFDRHILSFRERTRKPDQRIYRAAVRACRAKPREIFYVDDREDLTEAAAALGFHTFTFKNNPGPLVRAMRRLHIRVKSP